MRYLSIEVTTFNTNPNFIPYNTDLLILGSGILDNKRKNEILSKYKDENIIKTIKESSEIFGIENIVTDDNIWFPQLLKLNTNAKHLIFLYDVYVFYKKYGKAPTLIDVINKIYPNGYPDDYTVSRIEDKILQRHSYSLNKLIYK